MQALAQREQGNMTNLADTPFRPSHSVESPSDRSPHSLRIGVITSTYARSDEDYEVPWLRESVNRIAARGHEVTVIAPSYSGLKNHTIALATRNRWSTALLASCLRGSNAVTANSSHTADLIRKISAQDAQVIPYGATVRTAGKYSSFREKPGDWFY